MIFYTYTCPRFNGKFSKIKEFIKNFDYNPVSKLEKMIKKMQLEIYVKFKIKTSLVYSYCYIVKK